MPDQTSLTSENHGVAENTARPNESLSFAKFFGGGAVLGAALLPTGEAEAQLPPQPPAVVRQLEVNHAAFVQVAGPQEVLNQFNKDVHVYVGRDASGKLAISENQLRELSKVLEKTNYYVVILGDTSKFHYPADDHRVHPGRESVQMFLGQKLFDLPAFSGISDDRSEVPVKGASLFIITTDLTTTSTNSKPSRGWFFSTSPFHEANGVVDENSWTQGPEYVRIAGNDFRAARFADGVSKTISRIEADLNANIRDSKERMLKSQTGAQVAVKSAEEQLKEYQTRLADLNTRFPNRTGDLLHPSDVPQLVQRVEEAQRALSVKEYKSASDVGSAVAGTVGERIKALVQYPGAEKRIEGIEGDIKAARGHSFAFQVAGELKQTQGVTDEARARWERGESAYAAALDTASGAVRSLKTSIDNALKTYNLDGERITELVEKHGQLSRSPHASAAGDQLTSIADKLDRVQKLHGAKDPSYPEVLQASENELNQASLKITAAADRAAASSRFWFNVELITALGGLALAGAGFVVNRGVRRRGEEAREKLDKLKRGMAQKEAGLEELEQLKEQALKENGVLVKFAEGTESAKCAHDAKNALEKLWLFQVVANEEILCQAQAALNRGGLLSAVNYDEAVRILKDKPVSFSEKNRERIKRAFNASTHGVEALSVPIEEVAEFSKSMKEIDAESISLSEVATTALSRIVNGREHTPVLVTACREAIADLRTLGETLSEYARGDTAGSKLFSLPKIGEKLVPLAEAKLAEVEKLREIDPVKSFDAARVLGERLTAIKEIVAVIEQKRASAVPSLRAVERQLTESGLPSSWIGERLAEISKLGDDYVKQAIAVVDADEENSTMPEIELSSGFEQLHERVDQTVALNDRRTAALAAISAVKSDVDTARTQIGATLDVEPAKILKAYESIK